MPCSDSVKILWLSCYMSLLATVCNSMLQTLGPDGDVELKCGSHVARLLTKLPPELRADFRRHMLQHPNRPGGVATI